MPSRTQLWLNLGRTFNLALGNMGMGLIVALTGVALLDLVEIYGSRLSSMSYLITTRGIGNLLGSLLGGKLYDTYNTQVVSIIMMSLSSVTVLMIPLSGNVPLAHIMVFFEGLSLGAFGTGANVWIIRMWPENSSPALQTFHFAFGVGGLVAPFIAKPFLSPVPGGNGSIPNQTLSTAHYPYLVEINSRDFALGDVVPINELTTEAEDKSQVHYAFAIASALNTALVLSMIVLYFIDKSDFKPPDATATDETGPLLEESVNNRRFTRITLAMLCAYVCVYVVLECTSSEMFAPFAVKSDLHFSKTTASRVVAVYFSCFAASRLTAALVTIKVPVFWVLVLSHVILLPTAVMLVVWGSTNSTALWVGSALTGFGQGPLNAAVTAWTAGYITITNKMMSLVVVTGGVGSMSPPILVGQFLDRCPNVFLYVCLAAVSMCIFVFAVMSLYVRRKPAVNQGREVIVNAPD
ncbi:sodium-dependent glucose transporter 1A-like isoform X1 [Amblyomma americanum]